MNHDSAHRLAQCIEAYEQARREIDAMREELDQIRAELDGLRRWRLGIKRADLPKLAALRAEHLEAGR